MAHELFIVNVEGAVYRDDRYLIVKRGEAEAHAPGVLAFVGGTGEPEDEASDDVLNTILRREILEEVGVAVDRMYYVSSKIFTTAQGSRVMDIVFLCRYASGEAHAVDPEEVESVHWMTADEVTAHPNTPSWLRDDIRRCEMLRQWVVNLD